MRTKHKDKNTVSTLHSLKRTATKRTRYSRQVSLLSLDTIISGTHTNKRRKALKTAKKKVKSCVLPDQLKFRSNCKSRRVFKLNLFREQDVLKIPKKLKDRLMQTPDDDFDCQSDDDLIREAIEKKQREISSMLVRPRNLC